MNDLASPTSPASYVLPCSVHPPCRPSLGPQARLMSFNQGAFVPHVASTSKALILSQFTSLRKPSLNLPIRIKLIKFLIIATCSIMSLLLIALTNYDFT